MHWIFPIVVFHDFQGQNTRNGSNRAVTGIAIHAIAYCGMTEAPTAASSHRWAHVPTACRCTFRNPVDTIERSAHNRLVGSSHRSMIFAMPKQQISSDRIRQPSGHFSQATVVEARGRLVFISGMTARRADGSIAGIGDIEADRHSDARTLRTGETHARPGDASAGWHGSSSALSGAGCALQSSELAARSYH